MILTCPECHISYEVPGSLPEEGAKVRCTGCRHVWHAVSKAEVETIAGEEEVESQSIAETKSDSDSDDEGIPAISPIDDQFDEIIFAMDEAEEPEPEEPEPEENENDQNDIDNLFASFEEEIENATEFAGADTDSEEHDQAGIDALFGDESEDIRLEEEIEEELPGDEINKQAAETPKNPVLIDEVEQPQATVDKALSFWQKIQKKEMAGWASYFIVLIIVGVIAITGRYWVVRHFPITASLYHKLGYHINLRGLTFNNIKQHWENDNGVNKLRIEGELTNITAQMNSVPQVVFAVKAKNHVEIYRWVTAVRKQPLMPGERAAFLVRIPAPPKGAHHLHLFFKKR